MVYGTTLRLPGEFLSKPSSTTIRLLPKIILSTKHKMDAIKPVEPRQTKKPEDLYQSRPQFLPHSLCPGR
ncbi:Hypothetical protein FKW44_019565 [Caligus rogercresseyi]|uniref:Uncharacterized protein n=1 Tax=Caligus rogercresseyi TaxID=217165 RepID=A0A7T8GW37_CALRO|nr:Hypothetical protein FKW44_019565 [Caligus rogercresseyi]